MTYIRQSELAFIELIHRMTDEALLFVLSLKQEMITYGEMLDRLDKQFPNGWTIKNNDQTKA